MNGQRREAPSRRSVERWLKRWVEDGVLVLGGTASRGPKGTRTSTYLTPPIPPSRVGCEIEENLSLLAPEALERQDLSSDTAIKSDGGVAASLPAPSSDTPPEGEIRVAAIDPSSATDLPQAATNAPISDTDIGRTSKSQDETPQEVNPPRTVAVQMEAKW